MCMAPVKVADAGFHPLPGNLYDRLVPGSMLTLPRSGSQVSVASPFPGEGSHALLSNFLCHKLENLNFVRFPGDVDMELSLRTTAGVCHPFQSPSGLFI